VFYDRTGQPLDAGYIYIGTAGINPEVSPITVYWDSSLTTTAAQPIRTLNGYPSRDGSPGTIIINQATYSIVVRDKTGALVYSNLNSFIDFNTVNSVATYADLTALTMSTGLSNGAVYYTRSRATDGDGGFGPWRYDSTSTATANGGTVLAVDGGGVGRFFRLYDCDLQLCWFAAIAYVSPLSVSYTTRQGAPNITTALSLAITEAASRLAAGIPCIIKLPSGLMTLTAASIRLSSGIEIEGTGEGGYAATATHIRCTDTTGDLIQFGNPAADQRVFGAKLRNVLIYQDHGSSSQLGWDLDVASGTFTNKRTADRMINMSGGYNCILENVSVYGGYIGVSMLGGAKCIMRNIDINGVYDSAAATRQEGNIGLEVAAKIDTGPSFMLPTFHVFDDVRVNGVTVTGATLTYKGAFTKTGVRNAGFIYGVQISCAEEVYFINCNFSTAQKSTVRFYSKSARLIQGVTFTGGGFAPCGVAEDDAYLKFDNEDAGGECKKIVVNGVQFFGQTQQFRAISDYGSTATYGSVNGLNVKAQLSDYVGTPIWLINARHVDLNVDVANFNTENFYTGDDASAVYIGTSSIGVKVAGLLGGAATGALSGSYCINGVRAATAAASRVMVTALDMGLSGALFATGGSALVYPDPPVLGSGVLGDVDVTLTWGIDAPYLIENAVLTAARTATLSTTDINGKTVPDGTVWRITRTGTGAFNYNVVGATTKILAAAGQGVTYVMYAGGWREFI
jgi:hypothetical protein